MANQRKLEKIIQQIRALPARRFLKPCPQSPDEPRPCSSVKIAAAAKESAI
jgi:hypothetical protein